MSRSLRGRLRAARLPALLALLAATGAGGSQAWGQDASGEIVVTDPRITESSGLAVSPTDRGLLYTINDSGNDPVVYVVERDGGEVVGTTELTGLDPETLDPEALAVSGRQLWVADTGDNLNERSDAALYALPVPGPGAATVTPTRYPLDYATGRPNVEALLVDPVSGSAWLVTKGLFGGQVLRLPSPLTPGGPVVPEPVPGVRVPGLVTDATALPRGGVAVVRTYGQGRVYRLPDWDLVGVFPMPRQEQGETLTALPDDRTLLAGSEGSPALIDVVPLPRRLLSRLAEQPAAPTPSAGGSDGSPARAGADDAEDAAALPADWQLWLAAGSGVVVVAVAALVVRARRRTRHR